MRSGRRWRCGGARLEEARQTNRRRQPRERAARAEPLQPAPPRAAQLVRRRLPRCRRRRPRAALRPPQHYRRRRRGGACALVWFTPGRQLECQAAISTAGTTKSCAWERCLLQAAPPGPKQPAPALWARVSRPACATRGPALWTRVSRPGKKASPGLGFPARLHPGWASPHGGLLKAPVTPPGRFQMRPRECVCASSFLEKRSLPNGPRLLEKRSICAHLRLHRHSVCLVGCII